MGLRRSLAAVAVACLLVALAAVAPAHARTGACLGDRALTCQVWTGKVTDVNDGDTIDVDLAGDRRRRSIEIRLTAIQAMELTRYHPRRRRGQCHAVAATVRLERLLRRAGNRVRLAAHRPGGRDRLGRLHRAVAVRSGGRWRDVGTTLVSEGHALWMPNAEDVAWNSRLNRAQQEAARRGTGLWNPVRCGSGPDQDLPLALWANWDPLGIDSANVAGEWVKVRNLGGRALNLGGWWIRDAMLRRFTFPRGTTVAPGATVTVHVGRGVNAPGVFFWGLARPIFENANGDGRDLGDGAYLFDPHGDLRKAMLYPCVVACSDPRQGAVALDAQPRGEETVSVRNVTGRPVDLYGLQLALRGSAYSFGPDSVLPPGQTMVVEVQGDPREDTALRRHWGVDRRMLVDDGDAIRLRTFTGVVVACDAWGDGACIE